MNVDTETPGGLAGIELVHPIAALDRSVTAAVMALASGIARRQVGRRAHGVIRRVGADGLRRFAVLGVVVGLVALTWVHGWTVLPVMVG